MLLGGIETGGTKIVCCIADENDNIIDRYTYPTTSPKETLDEAISYFKNKEISALGIASFGPLCLDKRNEKYGYILKTPKEGWSNVDIVSPLKEALMIPVELDTDVNAAILAEVKLGAAKGLQDAIYITIGTGIGVGVYINGKLLHGIGHGEAGHVFVGKKDNDPGFSVCQFHDDCLEGLASGPSIKNRWGKPFEELTDNKEVLELEAYYIGKGIADYVLSYAPEKVVLGGGVMHVEALYPLIRKNVKELLNNYLGYPQLDDIENYIVPCALKDNTGVIGAIELAKLVV